jgi:hypothetical protein
MGRVGRHGQRHAWKKWNSAMMLHIEASTTIHAPQPRVVAIYRDYRGWPRIFPTIKAVRLIGEKVGSQLLEIDHREGCMVNILTCVSAEEIELKEWKKRYDATFLNRFEAIPEGTRFTLVADIALKGVYQLAAPFVRGYIRRQMVRLVLEPIREAAEDNVADRSLSKSRAL